MRIPLKTLCIVGAVSGFVGCSQPTEKAPAPAAAAPAAPAKPTLNIKPFGAGDPNFKPDYSKLPPELQKTFAYIDEHIDEHAENLRKWIQQPSI